MNKNMISNINLIKNMTLNFMKMMDKNIIKNINLMKMIKNLNLIMLKDYFFNLKISRI